MCCVPHCFTNSKRNKELSFYVIPNKTLRKAWLSKISRKDFIPTKSHRVCSSHFEGGKKTYTNNVATIVPKTVKSTPKKPQNTHTSLGLLPDFVSPIRAIEEPTTELTKEEKQGH